MSRELDPRRTRELALISGLTGIVVFGTPLRSLWARDDAAWWLPFALWLGLIGLGWLLDRSARHHGR